MAAITSSDPPKTRLSSRDGSYSQMEVAFLTTAIFVIFFMTSTLPRLTTWPKHLNLNLINQIGKSRRNNVSMVIVVPSGAISETHGYYEYFQWFCKSCRCYLCCQGLPYRVIIKDRSETNYDTR